MQATFILTRSINEITFTRKNKGKYFLNGQELDDSNNPQTITQLIAIVIATAQKSKHPVEEKNVTPQSEKILIRSQEPVKLSFLGHKATAILKKEVDTQNKLTGISITNINADRYFNIDQFSTRIRNKFTGLIIKSTYGHPGHEFLITCYPFERDKLNDALVEKIKAVISETDTVDTLNPKPCENRNSQSKGVAQTTFTQTPQTIFGKTLTPEQKTLLEKLNQQKQTPTNPRAIPNARYLKTPNINKSPTTELLAQVTPNTAEKFSDTPSPQVAQQSPEENNPVKQKKNEPIEITLVLRKQKYKAELKKNYDPLGNLLSVDIMPTKEFLADIEYKQHLVEISEKLRNHLRIKPEFCDVKINLGTGIANDGREIKRLHISAYDGNGNAKQFAEENLTYIINFLTDKKSALKETEQRVAPAEISKLLENLADAKNPKIPTIPRNPSKNLSPSNITNAMFQTLIKNSLTPLRVDPNPTQTPREANHATTNQMNHNPIVSAILLNTQHTQINKRPLNDDPIFPPAKIARHDAEPVDPIPTPMELITEIKKEPVSSQDLENNFAEMIKIFDAILEIKKEGADKSQPHMSVATREPYYRTLSIKLVYLDKIMEMVQQNNLDSTFIANKILDSLKKILQVQLTFRQLVSVVNSWLRIQKMQDTDPQENQTVLQLIKTHTVHFPLTQRKHIVNMLQPNMNEKIVADVAVIDLVESEMQTQEKEEEDFSLSKQNKVVPDFQISNQKIPHYNIHDAVDIQKLIESFPPEDRFKYDMKKNHKHLKDLKLYIAPLYVVPNQLAVYTDQDINPEKELGCYVGKRCDEKDENPKSMYIFQVQNKKGETVIIDGLLERDISSFYNHGPNSNLLAQDKPLASVRDEPDVLFSTATFIKSGSQLLFDYGDDYWDSKPIDYDPLFLHPTDNWKSPEKVYSENKDHYEKNLFRFDKATCRKLNLYEGDWVVPKIMYAIANNDPAMLDAALRKDTPVDTIAYACDGDKMAKTQYQQHLTPLMLACYLGNEAAIEKLIEYGADTSRNMMIEGYMPLHLLLLGKGDKNTIDRVANKLLDKMRFPFTLDKQRLGLLHYMIIQDQPNLELIEKFLKLAENKNKNVFDNMFSRNTKWKPHADFDYCILNNKFELLEILIKASKTSLAEYIKEGHVFKDETLEASSLTQLQALHRLLHLQAYNKFVKGAAVLSRINKSIADKTKANQRHAAPSQTFFSATPANDTEILPQAIRSKRRKN